MNNGSGSQGANGQSSSSSSDQSQQGQNSGAQSGASGTEGQNKQAPQRPAYVLESEWDAASGIKQDVFGKRVSDLAAFKAEADVRKQSLPTAPDKYEIKLPANFKPPEGVQFEWDMNDPAIGEARKIAHARGVDQETFSDMLGVYAATKIGEQTRLATARAAELSKLGSAAQNRIDAVSTWLKARAGAKADSIVAQLGKFPQAAMVEAFESIINQFSHQGGADYQGGDKRQQEQEQGKIPNYENLSFKERRVAQMQRQMAGGSGR